LHPSKLFERLGAPPSGQDSRGGEHSTGRRQQGVLRLWQRRRDNLGTPASPYPESVPAPVTLSQVAREAGVSMATASRAINGAAVRTVRADLRLRVLAAAERLQYVPDANAQAMARGRTSSLGLIVGDIADPYFSSIAAGVADAAERASLAVTLACTHHHPLREAQFLEVLTRQRARARRRGGRLSLQRPEPPRPPRRCRWPTATSSWSSWP